MVTYGILANPIACSSQSLSLHELVIISVSLCMISTYPGSLLPASHLNNYQVDDLDVPPSLLIFGSARVLFDPLKLGPRGTR